MFGISCLPHNLTLRQVRQIHVVVWPHRLPVHANVLCSPTKLLQRNLSLSVSIRAFWGVPRCCTRRQMSQDDTCYRVYHQCMSERSTWHDPRNNCTCSTKVHEVMIRSNRIDQPLSHKILLRAETQPGIVQYRE